MFGILNKVFNQLLNSSYSYYLNMQSCHRICSLSVKALRRQFSAVENVSTKKGIFFTPIRKLYTSNKLVKNKPIFYSDKTALVVQHGKAHLSQASNPTLSSATSDSLENSDTFRYTLELLDVSDIVMIMPFNFQIIEIYFFTGLCIDINGFPLLPY